ncbi:hypothetical protein [Streptomyces canus]|uniref:hypothetical protein n=1 Tax=Streptomyces canus TaxID=58343 RepID=UPI00341C3753
MRAGTSGDQFATGGRRPSPLGASQRACRLVREDWTYGQYEYVDVQINGRWQPLAGIFELLSQLDSIGERNRRGRFLADQGLRKFPRSPNWHENAAGWGG